MEKLLPSRAARGPVGRAIRVLFAGVVTGLVLAGVAVGSSSRSTTAPANSSPPTIDGTAATGDTVTANPGTWSGSTPINYQYQWQICGTDGNNCHDISGATAKTYAIRSNDLGNTLRVHVIGSNSDGSSSVTSGASQLISAGQSAPANTSLPTISGASAAGATLTAAPGAWKGTNPVTFKYVWEICDAQGTNCHDIAGANGQTYKVASNDAGNAIRVRVEADNAAGSSFATSAPSARIAAGSTTPAANGCPTMSAGARSVPVSGVTSPARLQIAQFSPVPNVVTSHTGPFSVTFRITDTCGQAVQGASLYATGVPYGQFTISDQQSTDANGNATLQFHRLNGFPAARNQRLLVMFVRATKPGEPLLAGISTRRLISFHVNLGV